MPRARRRKRAEYNDVVNNEPASPTENKKEEKMDAKETKWEHKSNKHEAKVDGKVAKQDAKTEKSYAVAAKRNALASLLKWLVILIGTVFAIFKVGGFSGGGILDSIKGLFP